MDKIKIDTIIRSKRKTIALVVTRDATLVVRAPFRTPNEYIEGIVSKNSRWIQQKMAQVASKPPKKEFVDGEGLLFLGKTYRLQVIPRSANDIELKDKIYVSEGALPFIDQLLAQWYRNQASKKIRERCSWYAKNTGYEPRSIRITNARKRWGSCGSKGTLNFSWRLVLAPLEVIDYVIVHELVHLDQPNHSKLFWNKLRIILPDFEKRKNWLKDNEKLLEIY
jgi:Predicted metal-dependent hydrolase